MTTLIVQSKRIGDAGSGVTRNHTVTGRCPGTARSLPGQIPQKLDDYSKKSLWSFFGARAKPTGARARHGHAPPPGYATRCRSKASCLSIKTQTGESPFALTFQKLSSIVDTHSLINSGQKIFVYLLYFAWILDRFCAENDCWFRMGTCLQRRYYWNQFLTIFSRLNWNCLDLLLLCWLENAQCSFSFFGIRSI